MTNDLRIVPCVATDEMERAFFANCGLSSNIFGGAIEYFNDGYQAALAAAPDYSHLVIVERELIEAIKPFIINIEEAQKEMPLGADFSDAYKRVVAAFNRTKENSIPLSLPNQVVISREDAEAFIEFAINGGALYSDESVCLLDAAVTRLRAKLEEK